VPTLPLAAFAERVRDLSAEDLAAFCAALWAARGWAIEERSDGAIVVECDGQREVLAPVPAGARTRFAVAVDAIPEDATIVVAPGQTPAVPDTPVVMGATDLYELSLYSLPGSGQTASSASTSASPLPFPPDSTRARSTGC